MVGSTLGLPHEEAEEERPDNVDDETGGNHGPETGVRPPAQDPTGRFSGRQDCALKHARGDLVGNQDNRTRADEQERGGRELAARAHRACGLTNPD